MSAVGNFGTNQALNWRDPTILDRSRRRFWYPGHRLVAVAEIEDGRYAVTLHEQKDSAFVGWWDTSHAPVELLRRLSGTRYGILAELEWVHEKFTSSSHAKQFLDTVPVAKLANDIRDFIRRRDDSIARDNARYRANAAESQQRHESYHKPSEVRPAKTHGNSYSPVGWVTFLAIAAGLLWFGFWLYGEMRGPLGPKTEKDAIAVAQSHAMEHESGWDKTTINRFQWSARDLGRGWWSVDALRYVRDLSGDSGVFEYSWQVSKQSGKVVLTSFGNTLTSDIY